MKDINLAVLSLHESLAAIRLFVAAREAEITGHGATTADATGSEGAAAAAAQDSTTLGALDAFAEYIRCTVAAAVDGTLGEVSRQLGEGHSAQPAPPRAKPRADDEVAHLRAVVATMTTEIEALRRDKATLMLELRQFNDTMERFHDDNNYLQVYRDRIVELQAVLNGTKRPGDITAEIGPQQREPIVPVDAARSEEQRRREVANELARLTLLMKDRLERAKAENVKLRADKLLLLGENRLLLDRVKVLDAQVGALSSSSSTTLRELERVRVRSAALAAERANPTARAAGGKLRPGETMVAGVVMERDVALWLRDMYQALLNDPDARHTLDAMRRTPGAGGDEDSGTPSTAMPSSSAPQPYAVLKHDQQQQQQSRANGKGKDVPPSSRPPSSFSDHVANVRRATTPASGAKFGGRPPL